MTIAHILLTLANVSLITLIASTGHAQTSSAGSGEAGLSAASSSTSTPTSTLNPSSSSQPTSSATGNPSSSNPIGPSINNNTRSASSVQIDTKAQDEKFNIPSSANSEWHKHCVNKSLNLNGDFQSIHSFFGLSGQWSVGPAVSTQLVKYDLAKKQAGFNTSVGAGASFRFYRPIELKDETTGQVKDTVYIGAVRPECRQTSFGTDRKSYRAAPLFSITPTLYATKPTSEGDLAVQPALLLGFFEDILNFGVGFNMTGPAAEKGNVFLLMSIGTGFSF